MKITGILAALMLFTSTQAAQAHCQIPCGVYDDGARFDAILEHAKTIEKSMQEITQLSAAEKPDYHKITRWTMNKEEHATKIQAIAADYFLTQRVKLPLPDASEEAQEAYQTHLSLLHQILVAAMKCKQSLSLDAVADLREVTERYQLHYFQPHGHVH